MPKDGNTRQRNASLSLSPSREPPVRLMPARMAARGALARLGLLAAEAGQWRGLSWSRGFPVPGPRGLASCLTEARDKGALFGVWRRQRRDRVAAAGVGAERVSSHCFLASWGQSFLSHSTVAREGGPLRLWSRRGAKGALEAVQPDEAVTDQVALSKEQRGGKQGGVSWRGAYPVYPHTAPLPQAVSTRARPTARPVPRRQLAPSRESQTRSA